MQPGTMTNPVHPIYLDPLSHHDTLAFSIQASTSIPFSTSIEALPQNFRGKLAMNKCLFCRKDKKKVDLPFTALIWHAHRVPVSAKKKSQQCIPENRQWPQKCDRCLQLRKPCSENTKKQRTRRKAPRPYSDYGTSSPPPILRSAPNSPHRNDDRNSSYVLQDTELTGSYEVCGILNATDM